jgi:hypothetical protein
MDIGISHTWQLPAPKKDSVPAKAPCHHVAKYPTAKSKIVLSTVRFDLLSVTAAFDKLRLSRESQMSVQLIMLSHILVQL